MTSLISFQVSESQNIEIVIDEQNKSNLYGYQSTALHMFDEVEVQYVRDGTTVILVRDVIQETIGTFAVALEKALKQKLLLDESFAIGKVGCFFNKITYANINELEGKSDIFSQYWVWSSPNNVQTWLYNVDGKIYLEISPVYPWLFSYPDEGEPYVSFDNYMKDYKPIAIIELQETLVQEWINQCYTILQKIETV